MSPESKFALAAVILAAGSSSRMGRQKMLLPFGNSTVLGHQIALWSQLPTEQIAVVCAAGASEVFSELDRLQFPTENRVLNAAPERGMFSSITCAAEWNGWKPSLTHWAIALGDQPHLKPETLNTFIEFARQRPEKICQPSRHGRARHPVLLPQAAFKSLTDSSARNLKEFLETNSSLVELVEIDDPGLDLDLDHPSDYQASLKLIQQR